jgi:hypothetical protein
MKTEPHIRGKPRLVADRQPATDRVFTRFMLDLQLIQRARRKMDCGEIDPDPGYRAKVDGFERDAFYHLLNYLHAKAWTRVRVSQD